VPGSPRRLRPTIGSSLARRCASELVGTALLVAVGLSVVVFDFGRASPLAALLPSLAARRAVTGFLFGATGMTLAWSKVGKVSGAHINPVVSLAFWTEGKLPGGEAAAYVASQLAGPTLGAATLLIWGSMGRSVSYGATYPGPAGTPAALAGEVGTTFVLVSGLVVFLGNKSLRRFTPLIFPPMYSIMVWLEGPYSGTSTNPARSLGPDVLTWDFHAYWVYVVGPTAGTLLAMAARRAIPALSRLEITVARVAHFELGHLEGPRG